MSYYDERVFHTQYENQICGAFISRLRKHTIRKFKPLDGFKMRLGDYVGNGKTNFISDWTDAPLGTHWEGNTVYFKTDFIIPSEFEGEKIYCHFDFAGECLLFINGKIAQGLDKNRSSAIIAENAVKGDKFELLVEVAPMWQHKAHAVQKGLEMPIQMFKSAYIYTLDEDLAEFTNLTETIFKYALYKAYKDKPSKEALDYALIHIKPDGDYETVKKQVEKVKENFARIYPSNIQKSGFELDAAGHSHLDVAYLWTVAETVRKCGRTFSNMLALLDSNPEFKFSQGQPLLYKFTKEHYPELYEKIKKYAKLGRWEVIGGMWIEADGNIPSGESFVRQFLYGNKFIKQEFGVDTKVCFLPDTFGFAGSLPQIMKKAGIEYFYTYKLLTNRYTKFPFHYFKWQGIDGSRVFSELALAGTYNGEMDFETIENYKNENSQNAIYMYGYGDGGGGVTQEMLSKYDWYKTNKAMPNINLSTITEHAEKAIQTHPNAPVYYGDLHLEWHMGIFTSQAAIKRYNRLCEILIRDVELLGVWCGSDEDKALIQECWELILVNQFHDILPGSSIKETFANSYKEYEYVIATLKGLQQKYLEKLSDNTVSGGTLNIINTLSFARDEIICIDKNNISVRKNGDVLPSCPLSDGTTAVFVDNIPAMGAVALTVEDRKSTRLNSSH